MYNNTHIYLFMFIEKGMVLDMDKSKFPSQIENIFPQYEKDLSHLVSFNSKNMPADGNAPFGKNLLGVLKAALAIAEGMGLKTFIDPDGYYGYAEIGEGDELIGVLGHLDVVPADDVQNWDTDPFKMVEKDGYFRGRGVQDDKGPALAALYALKLLLDDGVKFNKRIRFIFCTDEENLWRCVDAYVKKEEIPTMGFTPDSDFPLVYAEKGLIEYTLTTKEKIDYPFTGGTAFNAVPADAYIDYTKDMEDELKKKGFDYKKIDSKIEVIGKTAHAMRADQGINAITRLCEALYGEGKRGKMLDFVMHRGLDPIGRPIFGEMSDYTGGVTFNIGMADFKTDSQQLSIDIRYPATREKEEIDNLMQEAVDEYGVDLKEFDYLAPLLVNLDTPLVKSLLKAYQEVTGDNKTKPITMGGATFARSMPNNVAFGANFPGELVTEHEPNERIKPEYLKKAMEVYMHAFINLAT